MVSGWLLLDEQLTLPMVAGAACIVVGNGISLGNQARRKAMRSGV
jgi:drug/metabolite transporter (DMT)-like permease